MENISFIACMVITIFVIILLNLLVNNHASLKKLFAVEVTKEIIYKVERQEYLKTNKYPWVYKRNFNNNLTILTQQDGYSFKDIVIMKNNAIIARWSYCIIDLSFTEFYCYDKLFNSTTLQPLFDEE